MKYIRKYGKIVPDVDQKLQKDDQNGSFVNPNKKIKRIDKLKNNDIFWMPIAYRKDHKTVIEERKFIVAFDFSQTHKLSKEHILHDKIMFYPITTKENRDSNMQPYDVPTGNGDYIKTNHLYTYTPDELPTFVNYSGKLENENIIKKADEKHDQLIKDFTQDIKDRKLKFRKQKMHPDYKHGQIINTIRQNDQTKQPLNPLFEENIKNGKINNDFPCSLNTVQMCYQLGIPKEKRTPETDEMIQNQDYGQLANYFDQNQATPQHPYYHQKQHYPTKKKPPKEEPDIGFDF